MIEWILENFISIIMFLILGIAVFFAVRSLIKQKKSGGCSCASCKGCNVRNYKKNS